MNRFHPLTLLTLITLTLCGCTLTRPQKGGRAITVPKPDGSVAQLLAQGENPSQPSVQEQETTRTYTFPSFQCSNAPAFQHSSIPFSFVEHTRARTELGAGQKDNAREIGAKLSSLKSIVWVGVLIFVVGVASFFWQPVKFIIGSVTTSAAITLGGVALMILPTVVVGHEALILGAVALAVGAWFLAHRHGRLHGELSAKNRHPHSFWDIFN